jgi:hypothetical protein
VVTAHHVVNNVGGVAPLIGVPNQHARNRVLLEVPTRHPLLTWSEE